MFNMMIRYLNVLLLIEFLYVYCINGSGEIYDGEKWKAITSSSSSYVSSSSSKDNIDVSYNENTEIFISITSYRDSRCPQTIQTIFKTAKYPNRVKIGLVAQLHTEEDTDRCLFAYCRLMNSNYMYRDLDTENPDKVKTNNDNYHKCPYLSNIRTIEMTHQEARGPEYGRHLQDYLLRDEEFCLQIDSHIQLLPNWDIDLISMWISVKNEYGILSTYPPQSSNQYKPGEFPHVCTATFTKNGLIRNMQPLKARNFDAPLLTPFYSSQFSFSKCHALRNVPNDPNLMYLIDGIDYLYYARIWTRGYDVYSPHFLVALHDRTNNVNVNSPSIISNSAPKIVDKQNGKDSFGWLSRGMDPEFIREEFEKSLWRYYTILGSPEGDKTISSIAAIAEYGLGTKRSLDQLIAFTGMDTRSKNVLGMRCGNLELISFSPNKYPGVIDNDIWGYAAEKISSGEIPLNSGEAISIYKSETKNDYKNIHVQKSNINSAESNDYKQSAYLPVTKSGKLMLLMLPLLSIPGLVILKYFKINIL